jgi:hypothetical protein
LLADLSILSPLARRHAVTAARKEERMKYLALIYGDEGAWERLAEEERRQVYQRYRAFSAEADGKIVGGAETAPTRTATTVRVRGGETRVTDGPFEELEEPLGGFFVFDCDSMDEALDLAARIPGAASGAVEVRPAHMEEAAS